jgi:hypothetical protein
MANESNIIYAIELCQFRARVWYCKMSLRMESVKRARCEVRIVLLVKIEILWKITPFLLVNRYWRLKGACCCHVLCLFSLRRSRSWRQHDSQNISNCLPIISVNIDQLEQDVHSPRNVTFKGWLRTIWAIMSCYWHLLICKCKPLGHHTYWKCFHRFQTLPDLHSSRI